MALPINLIVGLGNPGARYADTRHNAGFQFIDAIIGDLGTGLSPSTRFQGDIGQGSLQGHAVRLLAPNTFMNRSGAAVAQAVNFYKLALQQVLVVHDELDLPPGTVRLKRGGGAGGHNGLRDIIDCLGSPDFLRLRIGIGHPGRASEVTNYVLRPAPAEEQELIEEAIQAARRELPAIVSGDLERAMHALHSRDRPAPGA
jgi:PTH1 family peptidyl-tRNA hydrolase